MYCKRCYAPLDPESRLCDHCGRKFDPRIAGTFLERPFPRMRTLIIQIIGTTLVGIGVAWFVAMQQMSSQVGQWSGH